VKLPFETAAPENKFTAPDNKSAAPDNRSTAAAAAAAAE